MKSIHDVTKEKWMKEVFPEWGTWLNEEIEAKEVPENTFTMWWLGNCGVWLKTHEGTNIVMDLWCNSGKRTHGDGKMRMGHQMMRMAGVRNLQPNLRLQPFVIDPFECKDVDAFLVSHIHSDHIDMYAAGAIYQTNPDCKFIGPAAVVEQWIEWGIPEENTIVMTANEEVRIGSVDIVALESFDRTALITVDDPDLVLRGKLPPREMNEISLNYLFKTSGGNMYHGFDSHYSVMFAKHGKEHDIDVALNNFGENPVGIMDKMTSSDILRMAEALQTKVIIPVHHDIWSNFYADPEEIVKLWEYKKDRLQYKFKPFIWQVGGQYNYPEDTNKIRYMYPRGFDDAFEYETDVPYDSFL